MQIILLVVALAAFAAASSASHRVARQTGECSTTGKLESDTNCCGRLFRYSYYNGLYVTYTYTLSPQEIASQCCRENFVYSGSSSETLSQTQLDANYPGHCYCDSTAAGCQLPPPTTTTPPPTTIDPNIVGKYRANSECCGDLYHYSYYPTTPYYYVPTAQETAGTCIRVNRMTYNYFVAAPPTLPGECYCDATETDCVNVTTTAMPTTTPMLTTTTPMPTTTTPEPTTTTTPEPTTTTPEPTTTTTPEPTTTTTPMPTTSTTPALLCPPWPPITGRVLGGTTIDNCTVDGVMKLGTGDRELCNAVYVYDQSGPFPVPMIYVPTFCKNSLDTLVTVTQASATGGYSNITFDPSQDIVTTVAKTDKITAMLPKPDIMDQGACQKPACVFNSTTMADEINMNDCFVTSFGSDSLDANGVPTASGSLNKVAVTQGTGCPNLPAGDTCFEATDTAVKACQGDTGAPVYCTTLNTGETVLMGLVDNISTCTDGYFPMMPLA